jgi:hypothetical protein
MEVGLLINFGERAEIKRKVLTPAPAENRSSEIDLPISEEIYVCNRVHPRVRPSRTRAN